MKRGITTKLEYAPFASVKRNGELLNFSALPVFDCKCNRCGELWKVPLYNGYHYDRKEAESMQRYLDDMRKYFLEETKGKLDIVAMYNQFLITQMRVQIEIELMTKVVE